MSETWHLVLLKLISGWFARRSTASEHEARRAALALSTPPTPADVLAPFMAEAIVELGYIKPELASWLVEYAAQNEYSSPRSASLQIRKEAPQLSSSEKKELGLRASTFYSKRMLDMLTLKGRQIPLEALDTTVQSALLRLHRKQGIDRATAIGVTHLISRAVWPDLCAGCKAADGRRYGAEEVPDLPLPGCWRDACTVSFEPDLDSIQ